MNKKFSWRAFISFGLMYVMLVLLVSGIMLYVAPPGRYAHWENWTILGLSKDEWQSFHTVFSIGFIILSVFHLFSVNWKAFVSYFRTRQQSGFNKKKEFAFSTLLVLVFFFGTFFSLAPFKNVMELGDKVGRSWEEKGQRAPIPHAELLTLSDLAGQLQLGSTEELVGKLEEHNIKFDNVEVQTLQEIAANNATTPAKLYALLAEESETPRENVRQGKGQGTGKGQGAGQGLGQGSGHGSGQGFGAGAGAGMGRKTLEELAAGANKDANDLVLLLKENNIEARKNQSLRTIAEQNDRSVREVYELINK